jgi:hypothetical protein
VDTIVSPTDSTGKNGPDRTLTLVRREALKDMLASPAENVVLDPATLDCQIHYRIGLDGRNKLASPRDAHLARGYWV